MSRQPERRRVGGEADTPPAVSAGPRPTRPLSWLPTEGRPRPIIMVTGGQTDVREGRTDGRTERSPGQSPTDGATPPPRRSLVGSASEAVAGVPGAGGRSQHVALSSSRLRTPTMNQRGQGPADLTGCQRSWPQPHRGLRTPRRGGMQALRVKAGPPQGETMRSAPRDHIPTELVTPHQILHSCPARAPRESAVDEENGYLKVTSARPRSLVPAW